VLEDYYFLTVVKKFEPLLIFMGVGAMTDFSALIVNPRVLLFGAAAQFGIFSIFGTIALKMVPSFEFSQQDAAVIAIIGGADGPTLHF
jgi:Na+-transporting methylmalonyl-CoA/oxaloacetate decarboxylase beta subunit